VSYLTSYAKRSSPVRGPGVDEKLALNLPGFHGGAYVRVFVEDTTFRRWRRQPPEPRIRFRIADCSNEISLWFELDSPAARENSLYKIDALLGAPAVPRRARRGGGAVRVPRPASGPTAPKLGL